MYAAALGSIGARKIVVEAGADVNPTNDFGATALMWCAGDREKVSYLLAKGASVTARWKVGRTPLLIAATYDGSVEVVRLMIGKGADVKAKDTSGISVLEAAASVNNLEAARLLLANSADPISRMKPASLRSAWRRTTATAVPGWSNSCSTIAP